MPDRPFLMPKRAKNDTGAQPYVDPVAEKEIAQDQSGTIQRYLQLADQLLDLDDDADAS